MIINRLSAALVAGLAVSTLAGCGTGDGSSDASCDHGRASFREALDDFLAAAQDDDRAQAERVLVPGGTIPDAAWSSLGDALAGADLEGIAVSTDRMGSRRSSSVVLPTGDALGDFETDELEDGSGCFGVAWGEYPEPPAHPDSATASVS